MMVRFRESFKPQVGFSQVWSLCQRGKKLSWLLRHRDVQ